MDIVCRPHLAGYLPLVEVEIDHDGEVIALILDLEQTAEVLASLRVALQRAMALHQLIHDRPGPLLLIAAEGAA